MCVTLPSTPGHPRRDLDILERGEINSRTWVQLERDGPYRYARLFETASGQPFLGEASVIENDVADYIHGVKQDLAFRMYVERTRLKLLGHLVGYAQQLKASAISPRQFELLSESRSAQRRGDLGLRADEIEALINLDYLRRDPKRRIADSRNLEEAIGRTLNAAAAFDAAGKTADAERCREKIHKLENRLDALTLVLTERGKAVSKGMPQINLFETGEGNQ